MYDDVNPSTAYYQYISMSMLIICMFYISIYITTFSEAHNCSNEWVDEWFHFGHLHIEGRKMSKSLKNFISINDYMNSKITKAPGDDFRIYCLQYKYHASLTYSIERIYEAEIYRKKVENFIYHMKSILILSSYQNTIINNNNINDKDEKYSNSDVRYTHKGEDDNDVVSSSSNSSSRSSSSSSSSSDRSNRDCNKPTVESKRIMDMFFQISISIDEALRDDFDTPKVLNLLSQLMSECYFYSQLITSSSSSSSSKLSRDDNNHDTSPNNKNYININHNHSDNIQQQQLSGQLQPQPIQPIIVICTYIGDLLTMLGLQFPSKINASKLHEVIFNQHHDNNHQHQHSSRNSSGSGDSYQISASDIDMILQFRANIRNTIVKNLKSIKEKRKSSQLPDGGSNNKNITQMDIDNEHTYQYLLKQCDNSREQLSQMLNIKIEDINNNYSTWRPLD
jgi:cysteinyl-tRNA synthetase